MGLWLAVWYICLVQACMVLGFCLQVKSFEAWLLFEAFGYRFRALGLVGSKLQYEAVFESFDSL